MSRVPRVVNRLLATLITVALERLPSLAQFVRLTTDRSRLPIALTRLRRHGVDIGIVYDIGAHRGEWTEYVRPSLPGARFFLFEANEAHTPVLAQLGDAFVIAALSSEERLVDFYARGGSGDSYYRETTERYVDLPPTKLQTKTLDGLMESYGLPDPDLIKVDVQGAEIDVLRGGRNALDKAKLVILECPVTEYNEGAPNIHEYFRFMEECGFGVVDFLDRMWQRGRMIHVDVLFAKLAVERDPPS